MDQSCPGRTSSCPTIVVIRSMCSKVGLVGLVVAHLWAMVPNYQAYLVLLGTHQVLPRSMVVRVLATQARDEGTCLPEY